MQIIGKKLGCVQLHISEQQYKRTELKVSYISKELTLKNSALKERSKTLVYFIDPDGMMSESYSFQGDFNSYSDFNTMNPLNSGFENSGFYDPPSKGTELGQTHKDKDGEWVWDGTSWVGQKWNS